MRVAFFEDAGAANFHPIALARPVFELICGRHSLRERVLRHCPVTEWGVFIREQLAETYREGFPEAHVNDFDWLGRAPTVAVNGRWLPSADALRCDLCGPRPPAAGFIARQPAFVRLETGDSVQIMRNGWNQLVAPIAQSSNSIVTGGAFIEHIWDLVQRNAAQLAEDERLAGVSESQFEPGPHVAVVGSRTSLHVDSTVRIEPFVVLDASNGPISIGPGVLLKSFTHVTGPCHIDRGAQLWAAAVRGGSTIGPECRVGGEVEGSILHGYVNKYHAGFLGHSYLCPWVNLGALTTTSDLKNDYTHVRLPVLDDSVDTGLTKLGSFIADHTKTGIGTLLNTGSSIGVMSMILPDGRLAPKHVPSFCKVRNGELSDDVDLERSLRTARIAMERRNCELTDAQERLWRRLYVQTRAEREDAILRFRATSLSH